MRYAWSIAILLSACTKPAPPPRRFGDAMSEVGRRFERAGKAAVAGKWDLAAYDLGEIQEVFEDDLPHAARPADVPVDPQPLVKQFAAGPLPAMIVAANAHDENQFAQAWNAASAVCNSCHEQSAKPFIIVPAVPGDSVPALCPRSGSWPRCSCGSARPRSAGRPRTSR